MAASQETIQNIIDGLDLEVEVRTDYSGRGMYGKTCLAIVTRDRDGEGQSLGDILNAIYLMGLNMDVDTDDTDSISDVLRSVRMDSMGLGVVLYFPLARTEAAERSEA